MSKAPRTVNGEHDTPNYAPGQNERPTRGALQDRESAPAKYNTSGMENAMGKLADQTHKRTRS